jgi:hypothetical protein
MRNRISTDRDQGYKYGSVERPRLMTVGNNAEHECDVVPTNITSVKNSMHGTLAGNANTIGATDGAFAAAPGTNNTLQ